MDFSLISNYLPRLLRSTCSALSLMTSMSSVYRITKPYYSVPFKCLSGRIHMSGLAGHDEKSNCFMQEQRWFHKYFLADLPPHKDC